MTTRNESGRSRQTRDTLSPRDRTTLDKLAVEVAHWQKPGRDQLVGAKPYHRALDNSGIKGPDREEWMELLKEEVRRRKEQEKELDEVVRRDEQNRLMRGAYAHERSQPPDTYNIDAEEEMR